MLKKELKEAIPAESWLPSYPDLNEVEEKLAEVYHRRNERAQRRRRTQPMTAAESFRSVDALIYPSLAEDASAGTGNSAMRSSRTSGFSTSDDDGDYSPEDADDLEATLEDDEAEDDDESDVYALDDDEEKDKEEEEDVGTKVHGDASWSFRHALGFKCHHTRINHVAEPPEGYHSGEEEDDEESVDVDIDLAVLRPKSDKDTEWRALAPKAFADLEALKEEQEEEEDDDDEEEEEEEEEEDDDEEEEEEDDDDDEDEEDDEEEEEEEIKIPRVRRTTVKGVDPSSSSGVFSPTNRTRSSRSTVAVPINSQSQIGGRRVALQRLDTNTEDQNEGLSSSSRSSSNRRPRSARLRIISEENDREELLFTTSEEDEDEYEEDEDEDEDEDEEDGHAPDISDESLSGKKRSRSGPTIAGSSAALRKSNKSSKRVSVTRFHASLDEENDCEEVSRELANADGIAATRTRRSSSGRSSGGGGRSSSQRSTGVSTLIGRPVSRLSSRASSSRSSSSALSLQSKGGGLFSEGDTAAAKARASLRSYRKLRSSSRSNTGSSFYALL
jgi:hypothetical protein